MTPLVSSMLLVFVASVIGSLGMAFLKAGSAHLTRSIWSFLNPKLLFGIALFLGSSVFYAWGIKNGLLSVLYPMVSLGYVWGLYEFWGFGQVFYPTRGILAWYSKETQKLQQLPGANDPEYVQTCAFWSPDESFIVFARSEEHTSEL